MRSKQVVLLLAIYLACINGCFAARITEPAFINYTTVDGLSLNKINHLATSHSGELLIATDNRINTFDGLSFNLAAATQQWSVGVEKIYELSKNEIAVINEKGELHGYHIETDSAFRFWDENEKNVHQFVHSTQISTGNLFLLDANNWLYKVEDKLLIKLFQLDNGQINSFSCSEELCWFAGDFGLSTVEIKSLQYLKRPLSNDLSANSIKYVQHLGEKLYLVLNDGRLVVQDQQNEWLVLAQLPINVQVSSLFKDHEDNLWVGTTESGLLWRPKSGESFYALKHDPLDQYSLPNDRIHDIKQDRFGVVWIATDRGLAKLDIPRVEMGHIRYNQSEFGLIDRDFSAIYELDDERLVIGNRESLTIYSVNGAKERIVNHKLLFKNNIFAMIQLESNVLWLGTKNGLLYVDLETYQVHSLETGTTILKETIYSLNSINSNSIVVGTSLQGAYILKVAERAVYPVQSNKAIQEVNAIYKDSNSRVWILHTKGVGRLRFRDTDYYSESIDLLSNFDITAMSEVGASKYWVGTKGRGLYIFDLSHSTLDKYSSEGIVNNPYVNGILYDGDSHWVSLDNSLLKINKANETTVYSQVDGIQDVEFNLALAHAGKSGLLYFGGSQGINAIQPKSQENVKQDAIPRASVNLKNSQPLGDMSKLPVDIHESLTPLSVKVKSLQTVLPSRNRIRYRFSEFGNEWNYSESAELTLPIYDLDPGEYSLTVQAKGHQSEWSTEEINWRFNIQPYLWKSRWAYALYAVLTVCFFYGLYSMRLNQLKRKAELLELTVQERTQEVVIQKQLIENQYQQLDTLAKSKEIFFENISHELKTPLTLVLGPIKKLRDKYASTDDSKMFHVVDRNANRVLDMVEQLLTISRLKSGLVNVSRTTVNLSDFVQSKINEFEYLVKQKSIKLEIEDKGKIQVLIDRDSLDKILNNLFSNAIKYNVTSGYLRVQYIETKGQVQLNITNSLAKDDVLDSKKVFKRFYREDSIEKGSGIGLSFTRDLVAQNGGKISISQSSPGEVTFQLLLDLSNDCVEDALKTNKTQSQTSSRETKVLLIEDDEDMRFYIKQELAEFTVETAVDGIEGIALAKKSIPDIIISDIMMPRLDGYGVASELSNHELTSHIPLILLTAKSSATSKIKGFKAGALEYLKKPFDANELRLRLNNIVKLQAQSRERYRSLLSPNTNQASFVIDRDKEFIQHCFEHLESNYATSEFDSKSFAQILNLSERQLQRKTKALFDLSPSLLIKEFRLKKAAEELLQGFEITATCFRCGFNDTAHFSRSFRQKYQLSPTEYKEKNHLKTIH